MEINLRENNSFRKKIKIRINTITLMIIKNIMEII